MKTKKILLLLLYISIFVMVDIFLFIAGTIGLLRNLLNILNSELTNYNQILAYIGMIFIGNYGFFNFIKVIKLILDSKE